MKFRALTAALFVSTLFLTACGNNNRGPLANQPPGGGQWVGGGFVAPGQPGFQRPPVNGGFVPPVQGGFVPPVQGGFAPPMHGDYYSWYCAYDPAGCYGDFYDDFYGGGGWHADFFFGSEQVANR